MASVELNGIPTNRGNILGIGNEYQYKKNYPNQGGDIYFTTYQTYERSVDRSGIIDQGTLQTYQLVFKGDKWYKGSRLQEDGKWTALTEKESAVWNSTTKKFDPIPNATNDKVLGDVVIKDLNAAGTNSLRYQAINNAKFQLKKAGGLTDEQTNNEFDISHNIAPPGKPGTPSILGAPKKADESTSQPPPGTLTKEELEKSIKSKARKNYDQLIKYPLTLNENFQDYIKFQMIEYKPRGIGFESEKSIGVIPSRERINTSTNRNTGEANTKREILGSVVLPIPGNISDGNTVGWGDARVDPLVTALTEAAVSGIREGSKGLLETANKAVDTAGKNTSSIKGIILGKFTEIATGVNPLTRLYGVVANPNLELLFNGPDLRNFTFTFRLSPRDKDEAVAIRKIIRFFKQGMSVKRTEGELFLGSPHTFQLSYWNTKTREHPYLNKFKECALKSFSVNYAPDGTYMTYNDKNEPSMTAYEITMQFTELEPVFDDDYTALDENKDSQIGY